MFAFYMVTNLINNGYIIDADTVLRGLVSTGEVYNVRSGLDADKPASCSPGNVYVATDTQIWYVCFVQNAWSTVSGSGGGGIGAHNILSPCHLDANTLTAPSAYQVLQYNSGSALWLGQNLPHVSAGIAPSAPNNGMLWWDTIDTGGTPSGQTYITVEEVDGTPSVANVWKMKVSNGTLTDAGGGVVEIMTGGSGGGASALTVEEMDGSPSVAGVTTIRVSNGTLTSVGGGIVELITGGSGGTSAPDYSAAVYHDSNQSIANVTWTALAFNQERYDTDNLHDVLANNSRLTCQHAGKYTIYGNAAFETWNSETNYVGCRLLLNGTTIIALSGPYKGVPSTVDPIGVSISRQYYLNAGDYVQFQVWHSSAAVRNILTAGNYSPEFGVYN